MSNHEHHDAINALENLGKPAAAPPPAKEDSVDASGFVGMLAKGQQSEADPLGAPGPVAPQPPVSRPTPSPRPAPAAAPRVAPGLDVIPMAKEIKAEPEQAAPVEEAAADSVDAAPARAAATPNYRAPASSRRRRKVPGWYRSAIPVTFTMGSLLFLVGVWSLLAVLSKATGAAMAPLFDHVNDSVAMPAVMLASLPVAIALAVMGMVMSAQVRKQDEFEEAGG